MKITGPALMLFFLVLSVGTISGCRRERNSKSEKDAAPSIRRIRFEGNKRFRADELRKYMQTEENSWRRGVGLSETQYLVKGRLKDDLKTIVQLYRSVGYYDARVTDTRIEKRKETSDKAQLIIVIEEGEPILLSRITFAWSGKINDGVAVEKVATLKEREPADMGLLSDSQEKMLQALKDRGYALAEIDESMEVDAAKKTATARFELKPGPLCRIGNISVSGLKAVPGDLVEREILSFKGELYTPAVKKDIEDNLLSMNVFSVVSVFHEMQLAQDGTLTVRVSLVESDPRSLKLGIGAVLEPDMHKARVSAVFGHRNLFHRLFGFQLKTQAGYAFLPTFWQVDSHGPTALFEPSLSKKGLLEKNLYWTVSTSFKADVEEDFRYLSPQAKLSVSRVFLKRMAVGLSYNFNYFYIYNATDRWITAVHEAYPAFKNPYRLGFIETKYSLMLTDRTVDPRNGAVFEVRYALADKSLGSEHRYNKVTPSVTFYWQMIRRLQLAVRVETGLLLPFGGTTDTSYWSNFFLGGYNTIRGWGGKKLAPSVEYCLEPNDCDTIRIGGRTMALGNVELRLLTVESLYVVTFLDIGDVQYDVLTFVPSAWNYSVGAGLRFDSPVGKVRFDIGARVNDPEAYQAEPRWGIHIGLGEAF